MVVVVLLRWSEKVGEGRGCLWLIKSVAGFYATSLANWKSNRVSTGSILG